MSFPCAAVLSEAFPPHDPRERVRVADANGWEVRASDGRFLEYFAPRGLLHVQFWHPQRRVSILSPSRLTINAYEVWSAETCKVHACSWGVVRAYVHRTLDLETPTTRVAHLWESVLVRELRRTFGEPKS